MHWCSTASSVSTTLMVHVFLVLLSTDGMCCAFVLHFGSWNRLLHRCSLCNVLSSLTLYMIYYPCICCMHKLWYGYCHSTIIVQVRYRNYMLIPAVLCDTNRSAAIRMLYGVWWNMLDLCMIVACACTCTGSTVCSSIFANYIDSEQCPTETTAAAPIVFASYDRYTCS